jgi:hypothetical protein
MGQPVAVVEKPSTTPGVVRFEANRTLTGMGHERFTSVEDAQGPRPAAELARRLLATGRIDLVHIYGNVITVELKRGYDAQGLKDVVEDLYIYYTPGFVPPPLEMPAEEAPAAPAGGGGGDAAAGTAPSAAASEAAKKIPAHLLERSRQAKERAKAKAAEG